MVQFDLNLLLASEAKRRHGIVARRLLIAEGAKPRSIDSKVRNRTFKKLYAGVYSLIHDVLTSEGRMAAAVLAGGPKAVLSHRSAATLHGLLPATRKLEVIRSSSPDRHRAPPDHASREIHPGLTIHRTRSIREDEIWITKGIPVTSPIRTMINLAERESRRTLREAVRKGISRGHFTPESLIAALEETRGRKGIRKLKEVLADWDPGVLRVRSDLEAMFPDFCREHRLPQPYINDSRGDYEVDFQFEGSDLLVEVDGGTYHEDRQTRHRDYRKSLDLVARGNRVIRLDPQMMTSEGEETAMRIRELLAVDLGPSLGLDQKVSPQTVAVSDRAPP